ncbi:hypothetical protein GOB94_13930 [Granulicella sp. 5B5]|uniref:hypothetical protein n=1 Tax=Granulicella sp. 5B5 TaxID=1617967 RepID=UPI0015F66A42|nr:hypothetical protein [Granulicella sp. 5B5]QMV19666.1 hypothetical protein GOB94_13930 [Granulicella sp. 5B5]
MASQKASRETKLYNARRAEQRRNLRANAKKAGTLVSVLEMEHAVKAATSSALGEFAAALQPISVALTPGQVQQIGLAAKDGAVAGTHAVADAEKDSGEKQLHRRVVVKVYDREGVLIEENTKHLNLTDTLELNVSAFNINSCITSAEDGR